MAAQLDTTKIDGLVEIGLSAASGGVSHINGFVLTGAKNANLEVAKIDSFTMIGATPGVQHEHIWTNEWIGPPKKLGS